MLVVRRKYHTYIVIDLNYSKSGEVVVSMDRYITEAIDAFQEDIAKQLKTPAGDHLFKVENMCDKISELKNILLHWLVAKIILLSKLARLDIN